MTPVEQMIQKLTLLGIRLTPQGEQLRYDGPQQRITTELLQLLKEKKADLLEYWNRPAN